MSRQNRRRAVAERLWRERFGEPPPIRTDADMMMRVLLEAGPRPVAVLQTREQGA
jgi:hypothetical protein